MTKLTKFILAIVLQLTIIFAIVIFKVSVLTGGAEVFLKIVPVDPTSPLRGDYATFQYDISNLNSYLLSGLQVKNGDTVYVVLSENGKYWEAINVSLNKPTGDDNQVFIKGKVASGGTESQSDIIPYQQSGSSRIHLVYGVEEYFIPEGKGHNFSFWNKEAAAGVVIDENGNAVLKRIFINGKPWP